MSTLAPEEHLDDIRVEFDTLYTWDHDRSRDGLTRLYEKAKRAQWNVSDDLDWSTPVDPWRLIALQAEATGIPPGFPGRALAEIPGSPVADWDEDRWIDFAVHSQCASLSQFLHGEQGAALCCGHLVEVVPDIDAKYYAATQVVDEARHVEVFHEYIGRLDRVYPMMPGLKALINAVLTAEMWQMKCLGMQVIAESMAMGAFKMMKASTGDLVWRRVLELTERDEPRHVSFGLIYLKEELEGLSEQDQIALEDFALAGLGLLMSPANLEQSGRYLFDIMGEVGIDTDAAGKEMAERYEADPDLRAAGTNPIKQYAIPNLERLGLVNDRTRPRFAEMNLLN